MSLSKFRIPSYLHHKARNKGRSRVNGKDIYFPGVYDSKESRDAYRELVARLAGEHHERLKHLRGDEILRGECLVVELMADYLQHADSYYTTESEPRCIRYALQPMRDLFGRLGVDEISPKKLKVVREAMIEKGWSRTGVNAAVRRVVRMFRWGVEEELVTVQTLQALSAVSPLKYGRRPEVPENEDREAVRPEHIDAVKDYVLPEVWAMVTVQRHSGMRPTEVCELKGADILRESDVWTYSPPKHKNAWRRKKRIVYLGPACQRALSPFLSVDPDEYIFSPRRAIKSQRKKLSGSRTTPLNQGDRIGYSKRTREGRKAKRQPGIKYTSASYRRAIQRACDVAGIKRWTPYQIRHSKAQEVRAEYGIEGASAALGNSIDAAQIYAERNAKLAKELARKCG